MKENWAHEWTSGSSAREHSFFHLTKLKIIRRYKRVKDCSLWSMFTCGERKSSHIFRFDDNRRRIAAVQYVLRHLIHAHTPNSGHCYFYYIHRKAPYAFMNFWYMHGNLVSRAIFMSLRFGCIASIVSYVMLCVMYHDANRWRWNNGHILIWIYIFLVLNSFVMPFGN